jgi:hypothetical protein
MSDGGGLSRLGTGAVTSTSAGVTSWRPPAAIEEIVRPFTAVSSTPSPARVPSIPAEIAPEAFIRWGAKSTFTTEDFRADAQGLRGVSVEDDDEEPVPRARYVYQEEGRAWEDLRVENEDDPDAYVVVRRVWEIAFTGPDGAQYRFRLRPDGPGTEEGEGQTPETPPLDQIEA